ncbi:MAG: hypothetical protein ACKO34_05135 [Vampirovibrionales bacterium]
MRYHNHPTTDWIHALHQQNVAGACLMHHDSSRSSSGSSVGDDRRS